MNEDFLHLMLVRCQRCGRVEEQPENYVGFVGEKVLCVDCGQKTWQSVVMKFDAPVCPSCGVEHRLDVMIFYVCGCGREYWRCLRCGRTNLPVGVSR